MCVRWYLVAAAVAAGICTYRYVGSVNWAEGHMAGAALLLRAGLEKPAVALACMGCETDQERVMNLMRVCVYGVIHK